jgi:hypothetical protein
MATGRYPGQWVVLSFALVLTYLLTKQDPPIRLPGKGNKGGKSGACPQDGGELVRTRSGKYSCLKCGKIYAALPKSR